MDRLSEIEMAISCGEMSAAQVFTQMKQLIPINRVTALEDECKRFYQICDDISTCGDAYKPEINGYFKAVESRVCEGLNGDLLYSDGYSILFKD